MSRKNRGPRDTAKDIILGLEPSGSGPREPRGGYAHYSVASSKPSVSNLQPIIVEGPDTSTIHHLQNQIDALQRQQNDLISSQAEVRRRLEKECEELKRKLRSNDLSRDVEQLKKHLADVEAKVNSLAQEVVVTKAKTERLSKNEQYKNEERNRYTGERNKTANQINHLTDQIERLRTMFDNEVAVRTTDNRSTADSMTHVQENLKKDLNAKTSIINEKLAKRDREIEELRAQSSQLNEKVQQQLMEIERKINDSESRLKENIKRYTAGNDLKNQLQLQKENIEKLETQEKEYMQTCLNSVQDLKGSFENDKRNFDERLALIEKNFTAFKKRLKSENDKLSTVLTADIKSRKIHESGLIAKMEFMEDQLKEYFKSLIEEIPENGNNTRGTAFDTEALRREMESIAADKNKISMEGLLRLEEKMRKLNKDFVRYNRDFEKKVQKMNENEENERLRNEINKINELRKNLENTQRRLADKIERQIPQDLNELTAKTNHIKQQLNDRIDRLKEENLHAMKELRNAKENGNNREPNQNKIINGHGSSDRNRASGSEDHDRNGPTDADFEQYKTAVKKLAESVTTVKTVLEKKIDEEKLKREKDVEELASKVNKKLPTKI